MTPDMLFAGIDVGSSFTKGVLLDPAGAVVAHAVRRTGVSFEAVSRAVFDAMTALPGVGEARVARTVATGYGRHNVAFADAAVTEITCQAVAVHALVDGAATIVDVGGQDTKVIRVGAGGRQRAFRMNRKCAAGTGAFLEEMALRLDVRLDDLDDLASRGVGGVDLSSYCTVFARSELLTLIREGRRLEDIALAVQDAVVRRIVEMGPLDGEVVMSGGVAAHHPNLVRRLEAALGRPVRVPALPQLVGAVGAARLAARGAVSAGGAGDD
jgi:predicted CoA-substrate-specific enzyme activase